MKSTHSILLAMGIALSSTAPAAITTNIVSAGPSFGSYFFSDTILLWNHGPVGDPFQTATLSIRASDVERDEAIPELDRVSVFDDDTGWIELGYLDGPASASTTVFDLAPNLFDDITTGLMVKIEIDVGLNDIDYGMILNRSTLAVTNPDPPPTVPEPGTLALAGLGLGALALGRRRRGT